MPTHTLKEHKHTYTQAPKDPADFGSLTSGSQSKERCSPAHNGTTDPLCSSCKFCSFSSGAQKSSALFCEKEEEEKEGVKPVSVCDH